MEKLEKNEFIEVLNNFAKFSSEICNAYGSFIFLPKNKNNKKKDQEKNLELVAFETQEKDFDKKVSINVNSTIIGYVARHKKPLHISPFDKESKHMGFDYTNEIINTIVAFPIIIDIQKDEVGVLLCDSKKNFAFSNKQCKILNNIANQIALTYRLYKKIQPKKEKKDWETFIKDSNDLIEALNPNCVDILRTKITNLDEIESTLGTSKSILIIEKLENLILKCAPNIETTFKLPSGDIIILLDNMMTTHIKNRVLSIAKRISNLSKVDINLEFSARSCKALKHQGYRLEHLIANCRKDDKPNKNFKISLKKVV